MITVELKGVDELVAGLGELQAKLPSITGRALTYAAKDAHDQVRGWLPRLLDRPTPWTMSSLFVFPAEKQDLRAAVAFKHEMGTLPRSAIGQVTAGASMRAQVYGGTRQLKASEKTLLANNLTQRSRPFLVPAKGAQRDQYGNVPGSFMNKVLYSGVARGSASQGYALPMSGGGRYFIRYLQPSARLGAVGIFKDMGKNNPPMPVFLLSSTVGYKRRVPFDTIAATTADRQLPIRFKESIDAVASKYGL